MVNDGIYKITVPISGSDNEAATFFAVVDGKITGMKFVELDPQQYKTAENVLNGKFPGVDVEYMCEADYIAKSPSPSSLN